jgi:hypothetical protein
MIKKIFLIILIMAILLITIIFFNIPFKISKGDFIVSEDVNLSQSEENELENLVFKSLKISYGKKIDLSNIYTTKYEKEIKNDDTFFKDNFFYIVGNIEILSDNDKIYASVEIEDLSGKYVQNIYFSKINSKYYISLIENDI